MILNLTNSSHQDTSTRDDLQVFLKMTIISNHCVRGYGPYVLTEGSGKGGLGFYCNIVCLFFLL